MKKAEYESFVAGRCQPYVTKEYCVIALNEEAGEVAGYWKKKELRGNPTGEFVEDDLKGELGDILFYLTAMAKLYGWSLNDVMEFNKAKLEDRVAKKMRMVS